MLAMPAGFHSIILCIFVLITNPAADGKHISPFLLQKPP